MSYAMLSFTDRRTSSPFSTERRTPHALEHKLPDPVSLVTFFSLAVEVLRKLVERRSLLHRHEALHLQLFARLLHRLRPARDVLVGSLTRRGSLLADDLPGLALDQVRLLQAAGGPLLVTAEDDSPRHLSHGDLGHPLLRLHGPHGSPHRLHRSHCLRHDRGRWENSSVGSTDAA